MSEIIYGDVLFIIDFSMDFIAMFITARILHAHAAAWRLCAAAALGGVYGVAVLFLPFGRAVTIPLSIAVCALMCLTALGFGTLRRFLLSVLLFFAAGATLSGVMTAGMTLVGRLVPAASGFSTDISPRVFAVTAAVAAAVTFLSGRLFSVGKGRKTVRLRILSGGEEVECEALVDSGNLAREPISGRPAILVRTENVRKLLPVDLASLCGEEPIPLERLSPATLRRTRLLPVTGVGGRRLMTAYLPDTVEIIVRRHSRRVDAVLALDAEGTKSYGDAAAVVPGSLVY